MQDERFEQFSALIGGIYRDIQKLKNKWTEPLGMKSVHIFWVYLLRNHPEGLSAAELSRHSRSNRSLVSREMQELIDLGYVAYATDGKTRRYGQKLILTEKGSQVAQRISEASLDIQTQVSCTIAEEDLTNFYQTLGILAENFSRLANQTTEE